ncbi:MAG: adenosylmethionine--8-amino-7-oxononanoate transaminase [Coxiellaceae bacterium]|nr:adenosylmethionine--8-amino-7-oxononanoate transaminase [Coxiellaceae bacterium]
MDLQSAVWHPCSNNTHKKAALAVDSAKGCYLYSEDGHQVLDAISSWWCKPLGHGNAALRQALVEQANQLEHTLLGDVTHPQIEKLSEQLLALAPHLSKAFYASDGACATEIALKMSIQSRQLSGETQRSQLIALQNSYHGETCGALAVTEAQAFRNGFESLLMPCEFIQNIPYCTGPDDILWHDAELAWRQAEKQLQALANTATALIIEPIVQGAGGMKIYSADFMQRLVTWAQKNNIHVIADEIMTGLGRTGKWLASDYAAIQPDFICLGKALTGGWLPMSVVLTSDAIFDALSDKQNNFIHSHTFSGNPLAAAVANAALQEMKSIDICLRAQQLQSQLRQAMQQLAEETGKLVNVRAIGGIVAADVVDGVDLSGFAQRAQTRGILLRPLGRTLYWLPPLTITAAEVDSLVSLTALSLLA